MKRNKFRSNFATILASDEMIESGIFHSRHCSIVRQCSNGIVYAIDLAMYEETYFFVPNEDIVIAKKHRYIQGSDVLHVEHRFNTVSAWYDVYSPELAEYARRTHRITMQHLQQRVQLP